MSWFKEHIQLSLGTDIYENDRYRIDQRYERDWNLEIRSVETDDVGAYKCHIFSEPAVVKTVQLIVQGILRKYICVSYPTVVLEKYETDVS